MSRTLMDDPTNRRIVLELQADGRQSHAELAERLGISRPTLIDRVKRLEAGGVIQGYAAQVSHAGIGKPVMAFVAVRFSGVETDWLRLYETLAGETDVLEAHSVAGEDCLLLKVVAETPQGLHDLLRRLRSHGLNASTRTTIVLETHFIKAGPSPFSADSAVATPAGRKPRTKN